MTSTSRFVDNGGAFQISHWIVDPASNCIAFRKQRYSLSPKAMDLLVFLAKNQGRTVTKNEIFDAVWPDIFTGDDVLWKRISELRKAFGDDTRNPTIIETIPKRGYRLAAEVTPVRETPKSDPTLFQSLWVRTLASISLAVLAALLLIWSKQSPPRNPDVPSGERPTILVGLIENLTGDSRLDGTLAYALEQRLLDTGQIQVASQSRVEETLRRMRQPVDAILSLELAREICLRDGRINSLVVGRVNKIGSDYEIGLRLVDPSAEEMAAGTTVRSEDPNQLLAEVQKLSLWILGQIGGTGAKVVDDAPARRVTTNSLEAYSLYLSAHRYFARHESEPARRLLRQALVLDPEFASAHLLLAMAIDYPYGSRDEAVESAKRAMDYRRWAGLAERNLIQAVYHDLREEYTAAATEYEFFLELQPDHPWAFLNLIRVYRLLDSPDRYESFLIKASSAQPDNLGVQMRSAALLIELGGEVESARTALNRAWKILDKYPAETVDQAGTLMAFLNSFDVWERWLNDDPEAALEEADRIRSHLESDRDRIVNVSRHASVLGMMYLTLGKLSETEQLIREFRATQLYLPEFLALVRGSLSPDDYELWEQPVKHIGSLVLLELDARLPSDLGSIILADLKSSEPCWPNNLGLRRLIHSGGFALRKGDYSDAIPRLEQALEVAPRAGIWHMTAMAMIRLALATAYERNGDLEQAVQVLETLSSMRRHTYISSAPLWVVGQARLAELSRQQGEDQKAQLIESQLRLLLQHADSDHPIRIKLDS